MRSMAAKEEGKVGGEWSRAASQEGTRHLEQYGQTVSAPRSPIRCLQGTKEGRQHIRKGSLELHAFGSMCVTGPHSSVIPCMRARRCPGCMEVAEELAGSGVGSGVVEDLVVTEGVGSLPPQCILSNPVHHMSCQCTKQSTS